MGNKRVRGQVAKWIAILYIVFVVCCDMMTAGFGNVQKADVSQPMASANLVSLESANASALSEQGYSIGIASYDEGFRVYKLTPKTNANCTAKYTGKTEIYSVQYNGTDYYYNAKNIYDGITPGLYYEDAWLFVFPDEVQTATEIKVSVTVFLDSYASTGSDQHITMYDSQYADDTEEGCYTTFSEAYSDEIENACDGKLRICYVDYTGKTQDSWFAPGVTVPTATSFGMNSLKFILQDKTSVENLFRYDIEYGGNRFSNGYDSSIYQILQVWKKDSGTMSVYRVPGTNRIAIDTNLSDATKYCYFEEFFYPDSTVVSTLTASKSDFRSPLTASGSNLYGKRVECPEDGLYMAGKTDSVRNCYLRANFGVTGEGTAMNSSVATYLWYGPVSASLGNIQFEETRNITENLVDVSGNKSDYAGVVTSVNGVTVTENEPYVDEYVSIDYNGNVKSFGGDGSERTYSLVTQTKYTKLMGYTEKSGTTITDKYIWYMNADGAVTKDPSEVTYATQDWNVTLTISPEGEPPMDDSQNTETTTSEVQTTSVPATSEVQTTSVPATTQAPAASEYRISLATAEGQPQAQLSRTTATAGTMIYVTVPKDDTNKYAYPSVCVTDAEGEITVSKLSDTQYQFAMPEAPVLVTVDYMQIQDIEITEPTLTGTYTANTKEENLPVNGKIMAVYGEGSEAKRVAVLMTTDMYSIQRANAIQTDAFGVITVTVPVLITVNYGGMTKTAEFYYQYTYEQEGSAITVEEVTPAGMTGSVAVSKTMAEEGETITVSAEDNTDYAFAEISAQTASGTTLAVTNKRSANGTLATFIMPCEAVSIYVKYQEMTALTLLTAPDKCQYRKYTEVQDLDLTGAELVAEYGENEKTLSMTDVTITSKEPEQYEVMNGGITYRVYVTMTYNGKTAGYYYTYSIYNVKLNTQDSATTISQNYAGIGDVIQVTTNPEQKVDYIKVNGTVIGSQDMEFVVTEEMVSEDGIVIEVQYKYPVAMELDNYSVTLDGMFAKETTTLESIIDYINANVIIYYNKNKTDYVSYAIKDEQVAKEVSSYFDRIKDNQLQRVFIVNVSAEGFDDQLVVIANINSEETTTECGSTTEAGMLEGSTEQPAIEATTENPATEATTEDNTATEATTQEVPATEATTEDNTATEATTQEVPATEATTEDNTATEATTQEVPATEVTTEDNTATEVTTQEVPATEATTEDNTATEATTQEVPATEDNTATEVTTQEVPATEDNTATEATTQEMPATEATTQEVPATEATTETPATTQTNSAMQTPTQVLPTTETPAATTETPNNNDEENIIKPGKVEINNIVTKKKKILLTWAKKANATSYEIYMSTSKDKGFDKIATVKAKAKKKVYSYVISKYKGESLKSNKKYYVKIRAVNSVDKITKKKKVQKAKVNKNGKLDINIKAVDNAVSYTVKISTNKNSGFKEAFTMDAFSKKNVTKSISKYGNKKLEKGKTYYVEITVKVNSGEKKNGSYSKVGTAKCK